MFVHLFINRLKCLLRDRSMVFWTLIFPIILSTLFCLAFSNLNEDTRFKPASIAVVDNAAFEGNQAFKSTLKNLSSGGNKTFDIQYVSKAKADTLLKNGKISAFIELTPKITLVVKGSGMDQSITRVFLDDYSQINAAVGQIVTANPSAAQNGFLQKVSENQSYLKEVPLSKANPDDTLVYYFALIAMACFYGAFWGLREVSDIQADMSPQAARINVAPVHKLRIFLTNIFAAYIINIVEMIALLCYLQYVLRVQIGMQFGYILLTCLVGCFTGVSCGAFIGALVKKNEGLKMAVLIGGTMTLSFLAGLMYANMKYIVSTNAPVLQYINPLNLIADAFYSLYYFDTYTRFYLNIGLLAGFAAIFCTFTYLVLRRQKYASL